MSTMRVLNDWLLTVERVAVHLPTATAVVADLHLGYVEARRQAGEAVPDEQLDEQLAGLARMMRSHGSRQLVIAGDLFEDGRCQQASKGFRNWLARTGIGLKAVIPGNHDAMVESSFEAGLAVHVDGFRLAGWLVVHGDGLIPAGPVVQGHEHPWLRWSPPNRALRPRVFDRRSVAGAIDGPCYLVSRERLILPAFSRDAAGVNVLSVACRREFRCYAIAADRVLDLGEVGTLRSRLAAAGRRPSPGGEGRGPATRASQ
jgi:putative SbcD/Mre11-related phosphoesterase